MSEGSSQGTSHLFVTLNNHIENIAELFSETRLRKDFLSFIVERLRAWTSCQCVGIRVVNSEGMMPYEAYVGFSQEFWEHENWLSIKEHQCGCIRVATGTPDPLDKPILTAGGSLWTNDLQSFGKTIPEELYYRYRGKCIESGFSSLAVLPIRHNAKVIGLIHFADTRKNLLPTELIQAIESVTPAIGEVMMRFITEEKLRKSEEKFKAVADLTHDWEYWVDPDGNILYCSPSCSRITGYSSEDFMKKGNLLRKIIHPEDTNTYSDHVDQIAERNIEETELAFRIITKRGGEKWIGHVCRPVFSAEGKFLGRRVSNRDITDRKYGEILLFQSSEKIKLLNENVLNMLKIMSHDIRSPLLTMSATLKLIMRGNYGDMDVNVSNTIQDLSIRVQQILGIADDCLGKAQVVSDHIKIDKNDIDLRQEIIEKVLEELSGEIETKKIKIDNRLGSIPTGSIVINANQTWIKVVYRNLFKNAIKYGGDGITIAYGYEDHGSFYKFCVYNTGTPIPEQKRDRLFTKFARVGDEPIREGVGMGLFLVKEIINQHGGKVWYEEIDNGSAFFFTLPK